MKTDKMKKIEDATEAIVRTERAIGEIKTQLAAMGPFNSRERRIYSEAVLLGEFHIHLEDAERRQGAAVRDAAAVEEVAS